MYRRILIALENSAADATILRHASDLARLTGAELLLVHVADGWAARHYDQLNLRESEEMKEDRAYLERWVNWEVYLAKLHPDAEPTFESFLARLSDDYAHFTFEYAAEEARVPAEKIRQLADIVAEALK